MSEKKVEWMRLASIGPHFMIAILIGFFVGRKLDAWLGTKPLWLVIFVLLGTAAGFLNLFRELALVNRAEHEEQERAQTEIESVEPLTDADGCDREPDHDPKD